jgi:UDP-glucose 4-epimerase
VKILVTGGLGFIGSHTVVALIEHGHEVVIVDNLSNSQADVLQGLESILGKRPKWYHTDISDTGALQQIFESENIEGVIHFAAFKAVGESMEKPLAYFQNNVGGMISLLEAMQAAGLKQLVFSSSCTVYGDTDQSPITEDTPRQQAASPYGTSKIICEELLEDLCGLDKLQAVSLRYFNPVGAHPSSHIGELPIGVPNNLVPYITQTAIGIREQLTIFGKDYPTADGTNIRDYIHVVDLAEAHVLAMEFMQMNPINYEVFNLGTGMGRSVLDVVKSFEETNALELKYRFGERRAGDVIAIWADATKAKEQLGWTAQLSLADMMRDAWNWQKKISPGK